MCPADQMALLRLYSHLGKIYKATSMWRRQALPIQLICNSTQDRSKHNSSMTHAPSASSPSHKDELNMRQNSNGHRAKQIKHHTNQYEKRRPYLLSMQSFEMCVAAFEILLPAVPRRSIAMTMTLPLKHYLLNSQRCTQVTPPEYKNCELLRWGLQSFFCHWFSDFGDPLR